MLGKRVLRAVVCCILLLSATLYGFTGAASAIAYEASPGALKIGNTAVYGDTQFQSEISTALDYLRTEYPADYASVTRWIAEIRQTDTYTRIDNNGICYVDPGDANASLYWLAGVFVHEAKHTEDDNGYFLTHTYTARESEARALQVQAEYLGSVNGWTDAQGQNWVEGYLSTNYWETIPVKYGDQPLK